MKFETFLQEAIQGKNGLYAASRTIKTVLDAFSNQDLISVLKDIDKGSSRSYVRSLGVIKKSFMDIFDKLEEQLNEQAIIQEAVKIEDGASAFELLKGISDELNDDDYTVDVLKGFDRKNRTKLAQEFVKAVRDLKNYVESLEEDI